MQKHLTENIRNTIYKSSINYAKQKINKRIKQQSVEDITFEYNDLLPYNF